MKKNPFFLLKPGSLLALSLLVGCTLNTVERSLQLNAQSNNQGAHALNGPRQDHGSRQDLPGAAGSRSIKAEVEKPENIKAWPLAEHSPRFPLSVRFQKADDRAKAKEVLAILEQAWDVEINQLGFPPPIPYDPFPEQGPKRLNAYLQRGADTAVEGRSPVKDPNIWWDAYDSWVSIDAWGKYAGPILPSTTAHEFNHALQAAYDWWESPGFFEASATYIQEKVTPDDNDYLNQIAEFQQHPDWPVHYDDAYKTWFMYGASFYLFFLEQRYFPTNPHFLADIWAGSRNRPRPFNAKTGVPDPATNEPDWVDSLEAMLPRGVTYADTLAAFARWRWYVGRHFDHRHFYEGNLLKQDGEVRVAGQFAPGKPYRSAGPLMGGSEYLSVPHPAQGQSVTFNFGSPAPGVKWVIQAVPGLTPDSDGDTIELRNGQGVINFGNLPERTLILTALPANGILDPDLVPTQKLAFTLTP